MTGPEANRITTVRCTCGRVELEAIGAPILSAACHCDDCQDGARQLAALRGAPPVMDDYGGTEYVLYRKDRVTCSKGAELLRDYKLRKDSGTNRVVASCCNAAMLVRFDRGLHWVSVYRGRYQAAAPALEMRVNTRFRPAGGAMASDVPSYAYYPLRFVAKLVAAKIAMLLGR